MNIPLYFERVFDLSNNQLLNMNASSDDCNKAEVLNVTLENKEKTSDLTMAFDLSEEVKKKNFVELEEREVKIKQRKNWTDQELQECQDEVWKMIEKGELLALEKELETITIDQKYELLKIQNKEDRILLQGAKEKNNLEIIDILFKGLDEDQRLFVLMTQDNNGYTALHFINRLNKNIIEFVLNGLDSDKIVQILSIQDKSGHTPLYYVIGGSIDIYYLLLKKLNAEQVYSLFVVNSQKNDSLLSRVLHYKDTLYFRYFLYKLNRNTRLLNDLIDKIKEKDINTYLCLMQHPSLRNLFAKMTLSQIYDELIEYMCAGCLILLEELTASERCTLSKINNNKGPLLRYVIRHKHIELIDVLLKNLTFSQKTDLLKDVLHDVVADGYENAIHALLKGLNQDEKLNMIMSVKNEDGVIALHSKSYGFTSWKGIKPLLEGLDASAKYILMTTQDRQGNTLLYKAIEDTGFDYYCSSRIHFLLKDLDKDQKYNLMMMQHKSLTPFRLADYNDSLFTVNALLEDLDKDQKYNLMMMQSLTPFQLAAYNDSLVTVNALLEGLDEDQKQRALNSVNSVRFNILYAIERNDLDFLKKELERSQRNLIQVLETQGRDQKTILHLLVFSKNIECIAYFLDKIESRYMHNLMLIKDKNDCMLLFSAVSNKNKEYIKLLLKKISTSTRAYCLRINNGAFTPLNLAANDHALMTMLLDGLDLDQRLSMIVYGRYGVHTVLCTVIKKGSQETLRFLLDGFTPDQKYEALCLTDCGTFPLHTAINEKKENFIEILLEGLEKEKILKLLKMKDTAGMTPLSIAMRDKKELLIDKLLKGLDQKEKDQLYQENKH